MIRLEAVDDGFAIFLNEIKVLAHSKRLPLFYFGSAIASIKQHNGSFKIRQKSSTKQKAREWKLVAAKEDYIEIDFTNFGRIMIREAGTSIKITFSRYSTNYNRIYFNIPAIPSESIFGCGEQFSKLDLKGQKVPLWSEEQGVGRGKDTISMVANLKGIPSGSWNTTYFALPSFLSSEHYYVYVDTNSYALFDFSKKKVTKLLLWAIPHEIIIGFANTTISAIEAVSNITGRQPALPSWTRTGVSLWLQGGIENIEQKLQIIQNENIPISSVYVPDWCGQRQTKSGLETYWNWEYDKENYKNLPQKIIELKEKGIRFIGYINPFIAVDSQLFKEASSKHYLVKNQENSDYIISVNSSIAGLIDLWNPEAFRFIKEIIKKEILGIGMSAWMADFGEYLPADAKLFGGNDPLLAHNEYPVLWAKANWEAIKEAGKEKEAIFFMRSGWAGTSRYCPAFCTGEQLVNWSYDDGLASVIPAFLSLGFCGSAINHSVIGGYTSIAYLKRSRECLMRWTELAAFTPIMRSSLGNKADDNIQLWSDKEILSHLARMSAVWVALAPYHEQVMKEYRDSGIPVMRHTFLHYEDDPSLRLLSYQYMYGRDILVAPVLKAGAVLSNAVLPDDEWIHLWTSRRFRGGNLTIEAPLGYPPVFYRANSLWASLFEGIRRSVKKI